MAATRQLKRWVALLRGINVGANGRGRKSVPMAELRAVADGLGWREVRTYIQSGNVVFAATGTAAVLAAALERAIVERFGFEVPVIVRSAAELRRARAACPFAAEAEERPNLVHVGFARGRLPARFAADVEPYCQSGERVAQRGQVIWADYRDGVGRSKLTPAVLDRAATSPVTMRNAKTLQAILALLEGSEPR